MSENNNKKEISLYERMARQEVLSERFLKFLDNDFPHFVKDFNDFRKESREKLNLALIKNVEKPSWRLSHFITALVTIVTALIIYILTK